MSFSRKKSASRKQSDGKKNRSNWRRALERFTKLGTRRAAFLRAYWDPASPVMGNGARCAGLAGYRGGARQLAVRAHRILHNERVINVMRELLQELGISIAECGEGLRECMNATTCREFLTKTGVVVYSKERPNFAVKERAYRYVLELHIRGIECSQAKQAASPLVETHTRETAPADPTTRTIMRDLVQNQRHLAEVDRKLAELEPVEDDPGTEGGV